MPARLTISPSRWTSSCCSLSSGCGWRGLAKTSWHPPRRYRSRPRNSLMNWRVGEIPLTTLPVEEAPVVGLEPERARVLLVDDDERNLLAVATVLEDLGEVVLARSAEDAPRTLLKGEFAAILLDVYMPGIDGYETAQIIRNREQTKAIPIVFLSAVNKETEHLMRGYSMGGVDYVFKPVEPVVLRSKVAVFVDLFAKTKEIERKAAQEQSLIAELLRAEQELRRAEQRQ